MIQSLRLPTKAFHAYPWVMSPFIISAPMRVMSGAALAVAVSQAGGLGFIGPGVMTKDMVADLEEASKRVNNLRIEGKAFQSIRKPALPIGVGFQLWSDEIEIAVSAIRDYQPCAAWLFAPQKGQSDLDHWTRRIRHAAPNTQIWVQIGTLAEAKDLLREGAAVPDVVVIQGAEAGGHGRAVDGLGLMALFPEIADALAARPEILLCAAGGIADGRGAAAATCLGASGIVMGTRFLAAKEARINAGYQREIVRACNGAVTTTRTLLYNQLRGTIGWPDEYSPRTIINKSFVEFQSGRPFEELQELHDKALKAAHTGSGWGPDGRLATYAGAGVGLIHDVKEAGTIVREVREQMVACFSQTQT